MLEVCALLIQCHLVDVKLTPRELAIQHCNVESRNHPRGKYYDYDMAWSHYYQQCMYSAGYVP
jgi:hypothetical protein